jgi:hypothetical protein
LSIPRRPKFSAFPVLTSVSDARWAALAGLLAVAFRPPSRQSDSFAEHGLTPLSGPTMFVMRWQHTLRTDAKKPQRSIILLTLKFAFDVNSGQVYADAKQNAECSPAVFDCALPRSTWGMHRHHLDPLQNKTAADLAIAMAREANRAVEAGVPVPHQPTLPEFYMAFPQAQRPSFERSYWVHREALVALGKATDDITDVELESFFWQQCVEADGYIYVPQRYLAHQGDYPVHPVDGSLRPTDDGAPGRWQGLWYFGDGRWNPAAQRPYRVYASMANVLGRSYRNPAFTVLKANSFFPADMTYPQFEAAAETEIGVLHRKLVDALEANVTITEVLLAMMRQMLGRLSELATDDDLLHALDEPHRPMILSFATGVRMVRYSSPPRPEALTWQFPGGHVDLYSTRRVWASRVAPVVESPGGSHGRAPTPVAD